MPAQSTSCLYCSHLSAHHGPQCCCAGCYLRRQPASAPSPSSPFSSPSSVAAVTAGGVGETNNSRTAKAVHDSSNQQHVATGVACQHGNHHCSMCVLSVLSTSTATAGAAAMSAHGGGSGGASFIGCTVCGNSNNGGAAAVAGKKHCKCRRGCPCRAAAASKPGVVFAPHEVPKMGPRALEYMTEAKDDASNRQVRLRMQFMY